MPIILELLYLWDAELVTLCMHTLFYNSKRGACCENSIMEDPVCVLEQ